MEFSIINQLTEYIKRVKPPFNAINCKFGSSVPEAFESVLKSYVRDIQDTHVNSENINSFNVVFTSDEKVYFEIIGSDRRSRVIIIDNNLREVRDL